MGSCLKTVSYTDDAACDCCWRYYRNLEETVAPLACGVWLDRNALHDGHVFFIDVA